MQICNYEKVMHNFMRYLLCSFNDIFEFSNHLSLRQIGSWIFYNFRYFGNICIKFHNIKVNIIECTQSLSYTREEEEDPPPQLCTS